jgi:hypothetical protein
LKVPILQSYVRTPLKTKGSSPLNPKESMAQFLKDRHTPEILKDPEEVV